MDRDSGFLPVGSVLAGKYRIIRKIGDGGSGTVYEALHLGLETSVALKVLTPGSVSEQSLSRLRREARLVAQTRHPNIVEVLDLGEDQGLWFLAMELLDGIDLDQAIELKGTYEPDEIASVLDPVLDALEVAHNLGLVHRDLKPANIFLARMRGRNELTVKLLDFGVVKDLSGETEQVTQEGMTVGTPAYMPPEQACGQGVGPRSDLYALGCVAYCMLCGNPPFVDDNIMRVLHSQVAVTPTLPSKVRPDMKNAAAADAFVMRALEKESSKRYSSATEMRAALASLGRPRA